MRRNLIEERRSIYLLLGLRALNGTTAFPQLRALGIPSHSATLSEGHVRHEADVDVTETPMLATLTDGPLDDLGWVFEDKALEVSTVTP